MKGKKRKHRAFLHCNQVEGWTCILMQDFFDEKLEERFGIGNRDIETISTLLSFAEESWFLKQNMSVCLLPICWIKVTFLRAHLYLLDLHWLYWKYVIFPPCFLKEQTQSHISPAKWGQLYQNFPISFHVVYKCWQLQWTLKLQLLGNNIAFIQY